jgi:vacuolar-type H+-ATPase subunit H
MTQEECSSKKIIYDNCEIYDPNDKLVGLCSKDRFKWYLSKGIADKISENAIKLKFEPKYRNGGVNVNTRVKRENKCYACGIKENLVRFHVIPAEYKKSFPETWKSHNSLDVLALCRDCASDANAGSQELKDKLEEEYGISKEDFIDEDKVEIKNLARKILSGRRYGLETTKLTEDLIQIIGREVTDEELEKYAECDTKKIHKGARSACEYIIKQITENNKTEEFIKRWKDHFVETMQPTDLPEDFYFNK